MIRPAPLLGLVRGIVLVTVVGAVFLWSVAERSAPSSPVIIHVPERRVEVAIDATPLTFVQSWRDSPIVTKLPLGQHTLCMSRAGKVLYTERFWVRAGQETILTAWDAKGRVLKSRLAPR
jgi:hypothetical protein